MHASRRKWPCYYCISIYQLCRSYKNTTWSFLRDIGQCCKEALLPCGLIPRPYPLTRRNNLVDQVEFLGLTHIFATVSTFKTFYTKPAQKMQRNSFQSHNLISPYHSWVVSPRDSTCSPDYFSLGDAGGLGTRLVAIKCCWQLFFLSNIDQLANKTYRHSTFSKSFFGQLLWVLFKYCVYYVCISCSVTKSNLLTSQPAITQS